MYYLALGFMASFEASYLKWYIYIAYLDYGDPACAYTEDRPKENRVYLASKESTMLAKQMQLSRSILIR